jgi:hypothetical protein
VTLLLLYLEVRLQCDWLQSALECTLGSLSPRHIITFNGVSSERVVAHKPSHRLA